MKTTTTTTCTTLANNWWVSLRAMAKVDHILPARCPAIFLHPWFEWILHAPIEITRRDKWTFTCYRSTPEAWEMLLSFFANGVKNMQPKVWTIFLSSTLFASNFTLWLGDLSFSEELISSCNDFHVWDKHSTSKMCENIYISNVVFLESWSTCI